MIIISMLTLRLILCHKLEVAKFPKNIFDGSPKMGRYVCMNDPLNSFVYLLTIIYNIRIASTKNSPINGSFLLKITG